jgi:hypothetical protein
MKNNLKLLAWDSKLGVTVKNAGDDFIFKMGPYS